MRDTINTTLGKCLVLTMTFRDKNGEMVDLSGGTFSVFDTKPAALGQMQIEALDQSLLAERGKARATVSSEVAAALRLGRDNHFRVNFTRGGCNETTERIWINVR